MSLIKENDIMTKMKIYSWSAGLVAALFTIMVAWTTLDLPRPAFISEVRAADNKLEQQISKLTKSVDRMSRFEVGTRSLLLNQEWWRLQRQIEIYETKPSSSTIRMLVTNLKQNQSDIKLQITALKIATLTPPSPRSRPHR